MVQLVWGEPWESQRRKLEKAIRVINLEHPQARGLVARKNSRIIGAMNMVPWPYCKISSKEVMRLFPRILLVMGTKMWRGYLLDKALEVHHPDQPHWHLGLIGVIPNMQGEGISSLIVQRVCEWLDELEGPGYLETTIPWIVTTHKRRYGFTLIGEEQIMGVRFFFLWRDPR